MKQKFWTSTFCGKLIAEDCNKIRWTKSNIFTSNFCTSHTHGAPRLAGLSRTFAKYSTELHIDLSFTFDIYSFSIRIKYVLFQKFSVVPVLSSMRAWINQQNSTANVFLSADGSMFLQRIFSHLYWINLKFFCHAKKEHSNKAAHYFQFHCIAFVRIQCVSNGRLAQRYFPCEAKLVVCESPDSGKTSN